MKSSQINFFLSQKDEQDVDEFAQENNLLIIPQPLYHNQLEFIPSISESFFNGNKIRNSKILIRKEDIASIQLDYIEAQGYSLVKIIHSPAIEFSVPFLDEKNRQIKPGRAYYIKGYFNNQNSFQSKSPEFLETANQFFKWIRKNFKNAKLSGYEGYLVSEQAAQWAKETGGELVLQ